MSSKPSRKAASVPPASIPDPFPNVPTETLAVSELKPHPKNYKKHPEIQLDHLGASLRQFGQYKNVVIARDGTLLAGHGVWEAMKRVGLKNIDVRRVPLDPNHTDALKILAADNELTRLSENDDRMLFDILREVQSNSLEGLMGTGFTDKALDELKPEVNANVGEDDAPPLPKKPTSKPGDLYILGRHRVLCGSSTSKADMKRLMGDDLATLLWTDPPYNIDYSGKGKGEGSNNGAKIMNDSMGDTEFRAFLTEAFANFDSVMIPGAVFYIAHAITEGYNFIGATRDAKWYFAQCLVWVKDSMVLGRSDYHWQHEHILYGWKQGAGHHRVKDRTQTTLLAFPRPKRSEEHPTMKPPELIELCIRNSTKTDGIVLDGFGGSGSTLIAAERTGRSARLMELDPGYVDVIVKRWETLTGEKAKRVPLKKAA